MESKPNNPDEFPPVTPALVAALDNRFPLRSPGIDWHDRQIWMEAGSRRVVDFLKSKLNDDVENALTKGENVVIPTR
jgi:hypothetical protein